MQNNLEATMAYQIQRVLRGVALSTAMLVLAAPAALADTAVGYTQAAPMTASKAAQPQLFNAPEPCAEFLSSAPRSYWKQLDRAPVEH